MGLKPGKDSHAHAMVVRLEDTIAPELQRIAHVDGDAAGNGRARVPLVHLRAARFGRAVMSASSGACTATAPAVWPSKGGQQQEQCNKQRAHSVVAGAAVNGLAILAGRQLQTCRACAAGPSTFSHAVPKNPTRA